MIARRMVQITKVGFLPIADIEQVAQHGDGITLLTRAQQLADRHIKHWPSRSSSAASSAATALTFSSKVHAPLPKVSKSAA